MFLFFTIPKMKITIFVDQPATHKQEFMIARLDDYPTFVDALNGDNLVYLKTIYDEHSRFFYVADDMVTRSTLGMLDYKPDFVVVRENTSEEEWTAIELFLDYLLCEERDEISLVKKGRLLCPTKESPALLSQPSKSTPPALEDVPYEMFTEVINDTLFVQIEKPYCELPYTVVIFDFSKHGYIPVFTDLFICASWGVSKKDIAFLAYLWKLWNMPGEFDLPLLLENATKACYPNEEGNPGRPEPTVYRKPIAAVLNTFQNIRNGVPVSKEPVWHEERYRKRKLFLLNQK